jgi:hypothetical protein
MLALTLILQLSAAAEPRMPIAPPLPALHSPSWKYRFEPNLGRYTEQVQYVAFIEGGVALFTSETVVDSNGVSVALRGARDASYNALDFRYTARNSAEIDGPLFIPHYARLVRRNVYPGIDLVYQVDSAGELEVHFFLQREAKLSDIALIYQGAEKLELTRAGELKVKTITGTVLQKCPKIHRMTGERFISLPVALHLDGDGAVRVSGRAADLGD